MSSMPDLRTWLENHTSEGAELSLSRFEILAIQEELSRLRQSSDFLRKQNKKLRKRVAALKSGAPDPDAGDDLDAGADADAAAEAPHDD